jgi:hypothetical protein
MWRAVSLQETNKRLCMCEMPSNLPAQLINSHRAAMKETCGRQTIIGNCTNPKSPYFLKPCPGTEPGADIRDCEFAETMPGKKENPGEERIPGS